MRIVTRGMGKNPPGVQGFISMGFGRRLIEQVRQAIARGKSSAKRLAQELEDVVVWAKLIRVNDEKPKTNVQGSIRLKIDTARNIAVSMVEGTTARVKKTWEDIKITVKRLQ
jgi:hypothetical protein